MITTSAQLIHLDRAQHLWLCVEVNFSWIFFFCLETFFFKRWQTELSICQVAIIIAPHCRSTEVEHSHELIKQIFTWYTPRSIESDLIPSCDDDSARGFETLLSPFPAQFHYQKILSKHSLVTRRRKITKARKLEKRKIYSPFFVGFQCDFVHERRNFNWNTQNARHSERSNISSAHWMVWCELKLHSPFLFILNTSLTILLEKQQQQVISCVSCVGEITTQKAPRFNTRKKLKFQLFSLEHIHWCCAALFSTLFPFFWGSNLWAAAAVKRQLTGEESHRELREKQQLQHHDDGLFDVFMNNTRICSYSA